MAKTKNTIPTESDKQEFYELMIDLLDNDDQDNDWYFTKGQAKVLNYLDFGVPGEMKIAINGVHSHTVRFHVDEEEDVSKFTPVTRFVCNFCKQDFRTDTKHNCKRDPVKRNCFSCKHNKGWLEADLEPDYSDYAQEAHDVAKVFSDCKMEHEVSALEIYRIGHYLNCPDWELKEDE